MPQDLGSMRPENSDTDIVSLERRRLEAQRASVQDRLTDDAAVLAQRVHDQLERDIADIERATAALRRAEPALESWTEPATTAPVAKPRPLWLLIGALWLSTAIVIVGALVVIAALAS
jgi:hypothetical protein